MYLTKMYFGITNELIYYKRLGAGPVIGFEKIESPIFNKYITSFKKDTGVDFDVILSGSFLPSDPKKPSESRKNWVGNLCVYNTNAEGKRTPLVYPNFITINYINPPTTSNGSVNFDHFQATLKSVLMYRTFLPIFAVIDHNSAHHLSYILAWYAFITASWRCNIPFSEDDRPRIVINFDNHGDGNATKSENIECGNWAFHFFLPHGTNPALNPVYISIGAHQQALYSGKEKGKTLIFKRDSSIQDPLDNLIKAVDISDINKYKGSVIGTETEGGIAKLDEIKNNIMNAISEETKEAIKSNIAKILNGVDQNTDDFWRDSAVYITVDRDFMIGSYTRYKDGNYPVDIGRYAVKSCLDYLATKQSRLVGFDVIGFPISGSDSDGFKLCYDEPVKKGIEESITDIKKFYEWVSHYEPRSETPMVGTALAGGAASASPK